jgi:hypothetical protein
MKFIYDQMKFKHFRSRQEMIDALCARMKLTKADMTYHTEGKRTILIFKSIKKLNEFFARLDAFNVAARSMTDEQFGGGYIVISSGTSACID